MKKFLKHVLNPLASPKDLLHSATHPMQALKNAASHPLQAALNPVSTLQGQANHPAAAQSVPMDAPRQQAMTHALMGNTPPQGTFAQPPAYSGPQTMPNFNDSFGSMPVDRTFGGATQPMQNAYRPPESPPPLPAMGGAVAPGPMPVNRPMQPMTAAAPQPMIPPTVRQSLETAMQLQPQQPAQPTPRMRTPPRGMSA